MAFNASISETPERRIPSLWNLANAVKNLISSCFSAFQIKSTGFFFVIGFFGLPSLVALEVTKST